MKKRIIIFLVIVIFFGGAWIFVRNNSKTTAPSNMQTAQNIKRQEPMQIMSSVFSQGQPIPKKYSCDGDGVNPPLEFMDVPNSAQSLVFIMDDPDAPVGTWTHWMLWNISPATASIAENSTPAEAISGKTSSGQNQYGGPCPPSGQHRYYFRLYALDTKLPIPARSTVGELQKAMEGHIVDQAELMGTYSR